MTGTERVTAFCDGVFAIAITLLVLALKVPSAEAVAASGLWHALGADWASYGAFLLSFVIIGIMWANHHNIFRYIGHSDHTFILLTLALLLCIVFLPYPTAVLAAYLPSGEHRRAATVFYGATLTVTAVCYNVMWRYATWRRRLLRHDADQALVDAVTREYWFGPICYAAATAIAFVNVWASLGIHALLAGLYVLPSKARPCPPPRAKARRSRAARSWRATRAS